MSLAYSDAPFYWPLRGSIALQNGSGSPTFTRATTKWAFNDEDKLIRLPSGAIEMRGYRPVINWFADPDNIAGSANWAVSNVSKSAATGPDGSAADGCLLTCTANNSNYIRQVYTSESLGGNTRTYRFLYKPGTAGWLRVIYYTGSNRVSLWFNATTNVLGTVSTGGTGWAIVSYALTASVVYPGWYEIYMVATTPNAGTHYMQLGFVDADNSINTTAVNGLTLNLAHPMLEDSTGRSDKTPSEYVYGDNGAGATGVKFFATTKAGAAIPESSLIGAWLNPSATTNNLLYCRDLTNAAWVKTNVTAALTQTGIDGQANASSLLTATANDATALQSITAASAAGCSGLYVRRVTGVGSIYFTRDGGANWLDITSLINGSTLTLVKIENTSVLNPQIGFKLATSGDQIHVDAGINHLGTELANPILTTNAAVTVNADVLTAPTSGNFSDSAGTILATVTRDTWATSNGSVVGSATRGLYTSAANSGVQGLDGTNTVNGPSGAPITQRKLGIRYSGVSLQAFAGNNFGSIGNYDGNFNLTNIGIATGIRGGIKDIAIWQSSLTDSQITEVNSNTVNLVSSPTINYSNTDSYTITRDLVSIPNITSNIYNCQYRLGSLSILSSINYNNINSIIYAGNLNITPSINNYFNNCQYRLANADSSINTSYNLINCIINTGRLDSISNIDSSIYNCQYRLSNANIIATTTTNVLNNYKINTGFLITSNIVSSLVNKNIIYSIKLDAEYSVPVIQVNYLIN